MSDGVKGGAVNRPGSVQEIRKLLMTRCTVCGLLAVKPIVVNGQCTNAAACARRVKRRP